MEEDIKRVEELIKKCDKCKLKECINCEISLSDISAIKRIIDKNKELKEENEQMKALFEIQASIAKELDFDTPDKMTKFRNTYYVPDTMSIKADTREPKRLELSYVDVSKFLGKEYNK